MPDLDSFLVRFDLTELPVPVSTNKICRHPSVDAPILMNTSQNLFGHRYNHRNSIGVLMINPQHLNKNGSAK